MKNLMNIHTGSVQTEEDWKADYLSSDSETFGQSWEEWSKDLVEVVKQGDFDSKVISNFLDFLTDNMRSFFDFQACMEDLRSSHNTKGFNMEQAHYELSSHETKSGKPEIFNYQLTQQEWVEV